MPCVCHAYAMCSHVCVQMTDIGSVVPRNSVIEANQSGLIAEPLLDITPQVRVRGVREWRVEGRG